MPERCGLGARPVCCFTRETTEPPGPRFSHLRKGNPSPLTSLPLMCAVPTNSISRPATTNRGRPRMEANPGKRSDVGLSQRAERARLPRVIGGLLEPSFLQFAPYFQQVNRVVVVFSRVTSGLTPKVLIRKYDITEVTFTARPTGHRMITWFGSSGGGLPKAS